MPDLEVPDLEVDVVIVGAGAAGLAAAAALGRHDVSTLLVERRIEPSTSAPRHRDQHPLDGVAARVAPRGRDPRGRRRCRRVALGVHDPRACGRRTRARGRLSESRTGRGDQSDRAGHGAAGLARGGAAPARRIVGGGSLRARIAARRRRQSSRRCGCDVARCSREHPSRAARSYLVGADGAHSATRDLLGVEMHESGGRAQRRAGGVPRAAVGAARRPPVRAVRRVDAGARRVCSSRPAATTAGCTARARPRMSNGYRTSGKRASRR